MVINYIELKKKTIAFSKNVGSQIVDGGKKCWKFTKENPDIVIGTGIAIVVGALAYREGYNYETTEVSEYNSNFLENEADRLFPSMNEIENESELRNYPENRKSPVTHLYRSNKGDNFVRGGTEEDKRLFIEANKNLFE